MELGGFKPSIARKNSVPGSRARWLLQLITVIKKKKELCKM